MLAALGQMTAAENSPLRAVVAYYPYCRDLQPWRVKVPALSLMGAQDEVAPPEVCQRVFAQLPPGTALQARVYPEARHGFDVSDLPPYAKLGSEVVGYNAGADVRMVLLLRITVPPVLWPTLLSVRRPSHCIRSSA